MKRGLLLLGGMAALGAAALALLLTPVSDPTSGATQTPTPAADQLARGAYLARVGNCAGCHTQAGGSAYAGGRALPTPFGTVFSSNLSPDRKTGLGGWSADDFWRAMHLGRSRDGRVLSPAFPYDSFTRLRRDDVDALFAYLKTLPAVEQAQPPQQLRWPFGTQVALSAWQRLFFRPGVYKDDARQAPDWNRGAYLSQGLAHCSACHGTRNVLGATAGTARMDGQYLRELGWYAPSLHADDEAGVAHWSEAALQQWLRGGRNEHASALGPMAEVVLGSTQHLNDADLQAMSRYLRSLPQTGRQEPAPEDRPALALRGRGAQLYTDHCQQCHGEQGEGRPGAYPALAGNRTVLMRDPANLVRIIQRGGFAPATAANPRPFGMPPFAGELGAADLAALASYLRHAWGNQGGDVSESAVLSLQRRPVE